MSDQADFNLLKDSVRNIPDFPRTGIQFKDITTMIRNPEFLCLIVDRMVQYYKECGVTKVVAIESRGFLMGGAIACKLGAGLIPIRKPFKLPSATYSVTYDLEYGQDSLEIHQDALTPGDVVLLHDDVLATGGTALASIHLLGNFNVSRIFCGFLIELDFLEGRKRLAPFADVYSLIHF